MPELISDDRAARPLRICDVCGVVDDHPRHLHSAGAGEIEVNGANLRRVLADDSLDADTKARIVEDIVDTTTQLRHPQCCKAVGCPDGSCNLLPDDLHGAALLEHIESGAHTAAVEKSRAVREAALQTQIAAEA